MLWIVAHQAPLSMGFSRQEYWSGLPFISVQSLIHVQLFVTPWTAACQASLSITNSQSLIKLMSIKLMMPSNHLILCHPLLLLSIFLSIRVFSNESVLHIRWPKYWSFSFNISPSNECSGLGVKPSSRGSSNPGIKPTSCLLLTNYSTQIKDDDKSCYSTPTKTLMPRPLSIQQHERKKKHSRATLLRSKIG